MARSKLLITLALLFIFIISVAYTMVTPSLQGVRAPRVVRSKTLKFKRANPKLVGLQESVDMIELEADIQDLAVDLIDLHDSTVVLQECSHGLE